MPKHSASSNFCPSVEIIPAEKVKLISWQSNERFLIMKRSRQYLLLAGLGEYLRNLREESDKEGLRSKRPGEKIT